MGIDDPNLDQFTHTDCIKLPVALLKSINISVIEFDGRFNEGDNCSIQVYQESADGEDSIDVKDIEITTGNETISVSSNDFTDIENYPYVVVSNKIFTTTCSRIYGTCKVVVNLK